MIGYKKVWMCWHNQYGEVARPVVLKLRIDGAVVRRAGYDKMRTNAATVLEAWTVKEVIKHESGDWNVVEVLNKKIKNTKKQFYSRHDRNFFYRVGDTVHPLNGFNTDTNEDCGSGIHFYLTKKEACNRIH